MGRIKCAMEKGGNDNNDLLNKVRFKSLIVVHIVHCDDT